jgi:protoporphyrinogen/coproporphyrinogen III oxidase
MRFAVVGGGIAGLAAAWELRGVGEVTVFEPGALGGCIRTTSLEGSVVDTGPDAFITRVPDAVQLCTEIGIADELVAPGAGGSAIWARGKLRRLPEGLVLGVPTGLRSLVHSGILSPRGVLRSALDLVVPRRGSPDDMSVRELVAQRFGAQVADRLVDPLIGGIHAGWTAELGAAEVMPQLVAVYERSRSMLAGLRRMPAVPPGPVFLAPRAGMGRLVEALVGTLNSAGVQFVAESVQQVRSGEGSVLVEPDRDPYDAVVLAVPGREAARLLGATGGAEALGMIPTASVALAVVSLPGVALPADLNGFLVPRTEGMLMTACSFASNKWPNWSRGGPPVVRISAGRDGDSRALDLDDDELVGRLLIELGRILGTELSASSALVARWPRSFPQYRVGHARRVDAIEDALSRSHPRVALAGASYRGSGIPACIASGRRAARTAAERAASVGVA